MIDKIPLMLMLTMQLFVALVSFAGIIPLSFVWLFWCLPCFVLVPMMMLIMCLEHSFRVEWNLI